MADELDRRFSKAVWLIRNGPKTSSSNETKLIFYSYFKQATEGDVTVRTCTILRHWYACRIPLPGGYGDTMKAAFIRLRSLISCYMSTQLPKQHTPREAACAAVQRIGTTPAHRFSPLLCSHSPDPVLMYVIPTAGLAAVGSKAGGTCKVGRME